MNNNYLLYLYGSVFDLLFSMFIFIFSFTLIYRYSGDSWKNSIKEALKTFVGFFLLFLASCFICVAFKYNRYFILDFFVMNTFTRSLLTTFIYGFLMFSYNRFKGENWSIKRTILSTIMFFILYYAGNLLIEYIRILK